MIEQVTLRDGTDAFVVPLERTDRAQLVAEFEHLSPESQRRRFLAPVRHLSDAMLDHLVDDVDGIDHVALVLCAETTSGVYDVVVELAAPTGTAPPLPVADPSRRVTPLLRDPRHRHVLRTRDQVCPWFH